MWVCPAWMSLELEAMRGRIDRSEADRGILETALEHSLVTRLTSLVAVDVSPRRDGTLHSVKLAQNLPKGWDWAALHGEREVSAEERARFNDWVAPMPEAGEAPGDYRREAVPLPKGSTPAWLAFLLGLGLLVTSRFRRVA